MIHLDFMRFVDEEPEIIPELVFVTYTLRHDMTQLMECDECQRIFIDEFIPLLRCIHAKRELLTLVLAVCGVFTRRQRLAYFFRPEVFY